MGRIAPPPRRRRAPLAALLLAIVVLAGCTGPLGGGQGGSGDLRAEVARLSWPTMYVRPTPAEPFEKPGDSILQWEGEFFGILSRDPAAGLRAQTVITGDIAYSSNQGIGWYKDHYPGDLTDIPRTTRMPLWNLRELVMHPDFTIAVRRSGDEANYTFTGTPVISGGKITLGLQLAARDGTVAWAKLTAPQILESPFMFGVGGTLPFPLEVPSNVMEVGPAIAKESESNRQHSFLVQLISEYVKNHAGMVPPSVDEETLALELLTSGKEWPINPFDGEPLRSERKSGHFNWCTKGSNAGSYTSYGFDNVLGYRPFGSQCP